MSCMCLRIDTDFAVAEKDNIKIVSRLMQVGKGEANSGSGTSYVKSLLLVSERPHRKQKKLTMKCCSTLI